MQALQSLTVPGGSNRASATAPDVVLRWTDNAATETGFVIERSTSASFTTINQTFYAAANATSASLANDGKTYFYRVRSVNAGGASLPAVAGTDLVPPAVTRIEFDGRAAPTRVRVTFSENVSATVSAANLSVFRRGAAGAADVAVPFVLLTYDKQTNIATFAPAAGVNVLGTTGLLTDGNYRATVIPSGVQDFAGNKLIFPQAQWVRRYVRTGGGRGWRPHGWHRRFQRPGEPFRTDRANLGNRRDFDGDGVVGPADFNLLASRFGADAAISPPPPASLATSQAASGGAAVAGTATKQIGSAS